MSDEFEPSRQSLLKLINLAHEVADQNKVFVIE
jgi:hypothetical protein